MDSLLTILSMINIVCMWNIDNKKIVLGKKYVLKYNLVIN